MRTARRLTLCCLQPRLPRVPRSRSLAMAMMAIGLGAVVAIMPASPARASRLLDCVSVGPGAEANESGKSQAPGNNARVVVDVPLGKVCVSPDSVEGERSYVRRTRAPGGMAIVEVSTTPFLPEPGSGDGVGQLFGRPDQPASW